MSNTATKTAENKTEQGYPDGPVALYLARKKAYENLARAIWG
jgi:hypothetical protein